MAATELRADSAHRNADSGLLANAVLQLPRNEMERLAQSLIERMDLIDGDPDFEPNGDEQDSDGDERGDFAWPEWDRRAPYGKQAGVESPATHVTIGRTEDDEEDDPHGQCDEDGVNTAFHVLAQVGAGCTISDEDFGADDANRRVWP